MSYDLRLAVKVEGAKNCYAVVGEPEIHSPTYNLGAMFRACMGWDYTQGEWYCVRDVLPAIQQGIHELECNEEAYTKYNAPNGWGTTTSALKALKSLLLEIEHQTGDGWTWNDIPIECLFVAW